MNASKILLIAIGCMLAGAATLCVVVGGVEAAPCALLFLALGWCYVIPVYLLVSLIWLVYRGRFAMMPWRVLFVLLGAGFGAGLMALSGSEASTSRMYGGTVLGGAVAGAVANFLIVILKAQSANAGRR